jgi:hypothetical protein
MVAARLPIVGYPPGPSPASWIKVQVVGNSSPVTVDIYLTASGLAEGTYNTTLRFVTGNIAGTQTSYKDLPISISVADSLRFSNWGELENFSTLAGIAASPQNLQIRAIEDWQIEVEYVGNQLEWLSLSATNGSAQSSNAIVQMSTLGVPAGEYNAYLRLLDGAGTLQDLITMQLSSYDGASLTGYAKELHTDATVADLAWSVALWSDYSTAGEALNWTLHSDVDWLKPVTISGNMNGNKTLELSLDPDALLALDNGWHSAKIYLEFQEGVIAPLELTTQLYLMLAHTLTADALNISIDSTSGEDALQGSIVVKPATGQAFQNVTVDWTATSNTDWLIIQNSNGNTAENSNLSLLVDKNKLVNVPNGYNNASITLSSPHPRFSASNHTITLDLELPSVDAVGPYVAFSGKNSPLVIQGSGFNPDADNTVHIGEYSVVADYVAPTQLHVELPDSFNPGSYEVSADNALGLPRASAVLKVMDIPSYTNTSVNLSKPYRRITLDAERQALLLTSHSVNQMDRLQLNASGEWDRSYFPMSSLKAVQLAADGSELLAAVAGNSIVDSILRINPVTLQLLGSSSVPYDFYETYDLILPMLNGQTLVIDSDQWPQGYYYPEWERFNPPSAHYAQAILARNRTLFIIGGMNSMGSAYVYDVIGQNFTAHTFGDVFVRETLISMSSNASRIVAGTTVYNRNYQLIGSLNPAGYADAVAVSPDGNSVFTLRFINDVATFFRHDISGDYGPYPADPEPLPLSMGKGEYVTHMIVSDDGGALFVLATKVEWGEHSPSSSVLYVVPLD